MLITNFTEPNIPLRMKIYSIQLKLHKFHLYNTIICISKTNPTVKAKSNYGANLKEKHVMLF